MIYVADTTIPAGISIPRTLAGAAPAEVALTLTGTADRRTYAVPVLGYSAGTLYYAISADFSAVNAPGEYEYHLTGEGANLAAGIIRLGATPNPRTETYETVPEYEQYNAN